MKVIVYLLILFLPIVSLAQKPMKVLQEEIDNTVWKEFKAAFETIDAKALNATYADEVLRVTPNGIDTKNQFKAKNTERFQMLKEKSASIKLDFWFESRHTNADTSYEVGYYKISTTIGNDTSINYGQFHIVLKKIDGNWKITQDWDTTIINGITIGQKEFERNGENKLY